MIPFFDPFGIKALILTQGEKIMAELDDLKDAITHEDEEIAATIDALNKANADLAATGSDLYRGADQSELGLRHQRTGGGIERAERLLLALRE
jgi:hypothetical protein